MRIIVKLIVAAYLASAIPPALAKNHIYASTVVATVNGIEITLGHIILVHERLPEKYQSLPDDQLVQSIFEQLIQQNILAQISENDDSFRIQWANDNERRMMRASQAVDFISSQAVGEEDIVAAYQEKFVKAQLEREFNASHILVENEESAIDPIEKVKEGSNFGDLAREYSTGPSGSNDGQLGWFQRGLMVPPIEEAVIAMEKGAISGLVKTDFGWHVIKLNDVRALSAPPLEQVRDALFAELQQKAVVEHFSHLQDTIDIARIDLGEFHTGVLKDPILLDQ